MRLRRDTLGGWLLSVAVGVAVCQILWWWLLREPASTGLAEAVGLIAPFLWPDSVLEIRIQDHQAWIIGLTPTLTDPPRLFTVLPLRLNRALAIFPLFWGLTLATPGRGLARRFLLGTALLLPVALGMALLLVEFELALHRTHLPIFSCVPPSDFLLALPDSPAVYYLWGFGRQLAVLVLPMMAPLLVWLGLHETFWRTLLPTGAPTSHRTSAVWPSRTPGDHAP